MIHLVCLFLFGCMIFTLYEVLILPTAVYQVFKGKVVTRYDVSFLFLVFFCLCHTFSASFWYDENFLGLLMHALVYILCFTIGKSASQLFYKDNQAVQCIVAVSLGMLIHALLSVAYSMSVNGGATFLVYDFWTKQLTLSTYVSTLFTPFAAISVSLLFENKMIKKVIGFAILTIDMLVAAMIGSRAMFVIPIVLLLFTGVIYILSSNIKRRSKIKILLSAVVIIIAGMFLYYSNSFGIYDFIHHSHLFLRFDLRNSKETSMLDNSSRNFFYSELFNKLVKQPFGGIELSYGASAHNTFLDILRIGGILPFIFMIIFVIALVRKLLYVIKKKGFFSSDILLPALVFGGISINFMVESMFVLNQTLMYMFFLTCGVIDGAYYRIRNQK